MPWSKTQLVAAASRGDRSAVLYGSLFDGEHPTGGALRSRLADIARSAGMALCGGGCMGFVNVTAGVRAVGYVERDTLPRGPVAFISHSGSVFSAVLRTRRHLGFTLVVSAGQELVTTAASYLEYVLEAGETRVVGLLLETLRDPDLMCAGLARAAEEGVAVVALTVGGSDAGRAMVAAHSGALGGADGAWEALFDAYGVVRVGDLDELTDTIELFAAGRRAPAGGQGIATVHDSGAERALVVDLAESVGVPFAPLGDDTTHRLSALLDPGLVPGNPLDVWGTGADTEELFGGCLTAMAEDEAVSAVVLAVDLVEEYDGDESYPNAVIAAAATTTKPVVVLSNLGSALDSDAADRIRAAGVPVLEGTRSGLGASAPPASSPRPLEVQDATCRLRPRAAPRVAQTTRLRTALGYRLVRAAPRLRHPDAAQPTGFLARRGGSCSPCHRIPGGHEDGRAVDQPQVRRRRRGAERHQRRRGSLHLSRPGRSPRLTGRGVGHRP